MFGLKVMQESKYWNERSKLLKEIDQKDERIKSLEAKIVELEKTDYNPRVECDGCENLIVPKKEYETWRDISGQTWHRYETA